MNRYLALQKIVECKSFTKAAAKLYRTQSAVSQMAASLERELGVKLLARSRAGVTLTREGKRLYPFVEQMVFQYFALREKAKELCGLENAVIRIGTLASISCHWMPKLLRGFQEQYPRVRFIMHQGDYTSIEEWIKTGAVDFGFVSPSSACGLKTRTLTQGGWVAVLPEKHPLAAKKTVSLRALAQENFILLEEGHYSEPLEAFRRLGVTPNIKYRIHDDYAVLSMVEAGLGVGLLAELVTRRTRFQVALRPVSPRVTRTLAVGYKEEASLPAAARRFITYLFAHKNELI